MSLKKYLILNKMVSNYTLGLLVNVILHVLILFIFLTILFFTVIAKKEKEETNSRLKSAIKTGINTLLSSIPEKIWTQDSKAIIKQMQQIEQENKEPNTDLENNNTKIFYNVMIIIIMFTVIISFYLLYIIGIKKRKIGFKYIMTENIYIFLILGSLEFIFFWYIIQNYIPIYSEDVEIEILEHIKSYF